MTSANRRAFFRTAGVGAAAVGAAALARPSISIAGAAAPSVARETSAPGTASGSMVAYIHDASNGQISVMVEGREVTVTDHQLVGKLAQALRAATTA